MIIRLSCNREEFRPIDFKPGFNAIIAERAGDSTDQHSRNARGKSTVLKLINYALAGNLDSSLRPLAENGWSVTLRLEMFGGTVDATRALLKGRRIELSPHGAAQAFIAPWLSEGSIALEDWKRLIGLALFRLEQPETEVPFDVSVRTLLSYVIRTDATKDPLKVIPQQSAQSSRSHVAFLLGLDPSVIKKLAVISKGIEQLKAIQAATEEGLVSSLRSEEELSLARATLVSNLEVAADRLRSFNVLENPDELVREANAYSSMIAQLQDESLVDARMRDLYRDSLKDSPATASSEWATEELFGAANVVLADGFKRHLNEVRAFHAALQENRRSFLQAELDILEERVRDRSARLTKLDELRNAALLTLDAGGALEEREQMRAEVSALQSRLAALDMQIVQSRELTARREELKLEQSTLRNHVAQELGASREKLDRIGSRFSQKMQRLYDTSAALTVSVDDLGYKFSIRVAGSGSTGVNRMMLFCFDLTMLEEGVESEHHPDFLIHDSLVFDGVDPRQRAGALRSAQEMVEATSGQYICTINSNDVPEEVLSADWFKAGVVRTILDTEVGGVTGTIF